MNDYKNILIIPDVHGRPAWKSACANFIEKHKDEVDSKFLIIFLGDYHDPYGGYDKIYNAQSYDNMLEIFSFYDENRDKYANIHIVMLFGNHDIHYLVEADYCRLDIGRSQEIEKLFKKYIYNIHLLPCYPCTLNGKKLVFSHAGFTKHFVQDVLPTITGYAGYKTFQWTKDLDKIDYYEIAEALYGVWVEGCDTVYIENFLYEVQTNVGTSRGGFDKRGGSLIWADVHDHFTNEPTTTGDCLQIFGHTYSKKQIRDDEYGIWMVDTGCSLNPEGTTIEI